MCIICRILGPSRCSWPLCILIIVTPMDVITSPSRGLERKIQKTIISMRDYNKNTGTVDLHATQKTAGENRCSIGDKDESATTWRAQRQLIGIRTGGLLLSSLLRRLGSSLCGLLCLRFLLLTRSILWVFWRILPQDTDLKA